MENEIKICFTGHRPNKLGGYDWNSPQNTSIRIRLKQLVISILEKNKNSNIHFICGNISG